jgi:hypothetical protein
MANKNVKGLEHVAKQKDKIAADRKRVVNATAEAILQAITFGQYFPQEKTNLEGLRKSAERRLHKLLKKIRREVLN